VYVSSLVFQQLQWLPKPFHNARWCRRSVVQLQHGSSTFYICFNWGVLLFGLWSQTTYKSVCLAGTGP